MEPSFHSILQSTISFTLARNPTATRTLCLFGVVNKWPNPAYVRQDRISLPTGPRDSRLIMSQLISEGYLSLQGRNRAHSKRVYTGSHYIHLGSKHVFVFNVNKCELCQTFRLRDDHCRCNRQQNYSSVLHPTLVPPSCWM